MKKYTLAIAVAVFYLLVSGVKAWPQVEADKLKPIDYSSPIIQTVLTIQKAYQDGIIETLWKQRTKKTQELQGYKILEGTKQSKRGICKRRIISNAQLTGMKFITNNRVWVAVNTPGVFQFNKRSQFKGFYLIREEGVWKLALMHLYVKKVNEDIKLLSKAIKKYYIVTQKLPETLSDLLELKLTGLNNIPVDLFNENNESYVYKIINKTTYKLYSLGPDSDDDQGTVKWKSGVYEVSDGDIIKTNSLAKFPTIFKK